MERQVGIIGAGVSGLVACKHVMEMGFKPIVFESKRNAGGVWGQTVKSTRLQSHKQAFRFSDFPWPDSVKEDFPDHNQVLDYIESYARHFDLLQYIKFNSKVTCIDYEGPFDEGMDSWDFCGKNGEPFSPKGKWTISVENQNTETNEIYQVDFVIVCIGKFSDLPNIPEFPENQGPEAFDGKVIHSMHYSAMDDASALEFIKGKRVTVVGMMKSGLDIANECAEANGVGHPCTVLYRKAHWSFPDYYPWGVPLALLYRNRFAEFMVHKPGEGFLLSLLATLLTPLRWFISKFVESYIKSKLQLKKYNMIPEHSFNEEFFSGTISITPPHFYDRVEQGSIILNKSTRFSFCKDGLMIDEKTTPLKTDVVILCTGYNGDEKLKNIFRSAMYQNYMTGSSNSTVRLYRECIHPRIPQLAIIGYTNSLVYLYTSEMRCIWIAHLLKGTFKLPGMREMEADLMKHYSGENYKESCLCSAPTWYHDMLCKDMKLNPRRKKGFSAELFQPYGPADYANLFPPPPLNDLVISPR
ncbi:flavin-containing monooxygenase [Ranunculus cassubicifolius]